MMASLMNILSAAPKNSKVYIFARLFLSLFSFINLYIFYANISTDGTLKDGIPVLVQTRKRKSPPFVPSEVEHARCERVVGPLPFTATITSKVLEADNSVYKRAQIINGTKGLWYDSEEDILYFVRCFL